ncbi:MAG: translocation/assembly module TamB domain-containing protein [Candidatus Delongbacteria bacterium]
MNSTLQPSSPAPPPPPAPPRRLAWGWRLLLACALLLGVPATLVLLPPLRQALLVGTLPDLLAGLPGGGPRLDGLRWPRLGRLEAEGLLWVVDGDTLLSARRIRLELELKPLLRRDLRLRELQAEDLTLDLPALRRAFPPAATPAPESRRWLRPGAWSGLPSLACARLEVRGGPLRLDSLRSVRRFTVLGGLELGAGHEPAWWLDSLQLSLTEPATELEGADLRLEPARGLLGGRLLIRSQPDWSARLDVTGPAGQRRARLEVRQVERTLLGLELGVQALRQDSLWSGLRLTGRMNLAGSADWGSWPPLQPVLRVAPDLPPLTDAGLSLELNWASRRDLRLVLEARPGAWLEGAFVHAELLKEGLSLDSLELRPRGLRLRGHARLEAQHLKAGLEAVLLDSSGLDLLPLTRGWPRDLLARLGLEVDLPPAGGGNAAFSLGASSRGLRLSLAGRATDGSRLRLDTLLVRETAGGARVTEPGGGRLTRDEAGGWSSPSLVLAGDLGRWELGGRLDRLGSGPFTLDGRLAGLSPAAGRLLHLPDSLRRRLNAALALGEPAHLQATGRLRQRSAGRQLNAAGHLLLPGPERLAGLLPAGARLTGLGDPRLDWSLDWRQDRRGASWQAGLSGQAPGWLDSLAATLAGTRAELSLSDGRLRLPGLELDLAARRSGPLQELAASWQLDNLDLLTRFLPALAGASAQLSGTLGLRGRSSDPDLDLAARGSYRQGGLELANVDLTARRDSLGLYAEARVPGGLQAGGLWLDSLSSTYQGPAGPGKLFFPGQGWIRAVGGESSLEAELGLERAGGWVVSGRRLTLGAGQTRLETRRPFTLLLPASGGLRLDSLELAGPSGSLLASADLATVPAPAWARLTLDLDPRSLPWPERVPQGLRPERLRLEVDASRADGLRSSLKLDGLQARSGPKMDLLARVNGELLRPELAAWVTGAADTLLRAAGRLPLQLRLWPPALLPALDPLELELVFHELPVPLARPVEGGKEATARLGGTLRLQGNAAEPQLRGDLRVSAPDDPLLEDYLALLILDWANAPGAGPLLRADLDLSRAGRQLATGHAAVPARFSAEGQWVTGELEAELQANGLSLAELNSLLPEDLWLAGQARLNLRAAGPLRNPELEGRLSVAGLEARQSQGTHVFGEADLTLGGDLAHPGLWGRVVLENGEVHLPKIAHSLLDARGSALLWEMEVGEDRRMDPAAGQTGSWLDSLELDLDLRIPNTVRVRGGDLDLESRGDLTLNRQAGRLSLAGDLQVLSGEFRLLGRQFTAESGTLVWYGDHNLSPHLNLDLFTTAGSTRVMVALTGTLNRPLLELSSDPPLEEGEIMALLLFRRSTDELDSQQENQLREQATQLATDYGMAALQANLSRTLHLDLLRWDSAGSDWQGTLLVGKYLGPRVLVYYEQSLSLQESYRLHVDYVVTRHLRLDTSMGTRGQSGVSLNWSRVW